MSQQDQDKKLDMNPVDKQEDRLPVGELKWSQEEEEEREKEAKVVAEQKQEEDTGSGQEKEVIEAKKVDSKEDLINDLQKTDTESDKLKDFEDTLTPIDFKEYPIKLDPQKEVSAAVEAPVKTFEIEPDVEYSTKDPDQQDYASYEKEENDESDYGKVDQISDVEETKTQKKGWKFTLKILWIPLTLILSLLIGLIIGNTVIGEQPVSDIFKWSSWEHLYNLIYEK